MGDVAATGDVAAMTNSRFDHWIGKHCLVLGYARAGAWVIGMRSIFGDIRFRTPEF
jgi:hypothetical protein